MSTTSSFTRRVLAAVLSGSVVAAVVAFSAVAEPVHAAGSNQPRACDFDDDDLADIAAAAPVLEVNGRFNAGSLYIHENVGGSAAGTATWSQDSPGVPGVADLNDRFGTSLVCGDFNNDSYWDLAIGVPFESFNGFTHSGAVNVIYGGPSGLGSEVRDPQAFSLANPFLEGNLEHSGHFGHSLAMGDFNGDGFSDLAVGSPGASAGLESGAGAVWILEGHPTGLTTVGQVISQATPGVTNKPESGDRFGDTVAAGDFDNDGFDDLVLSAPRERLAGIDDAGLVHVLYGSGGGIVPSDSQTWSQATSGVAGALEENDRFGTTLATGDIDHDGEDDLAIGVPLEDIGSREDAGLVQVLYGGGNGLSSQRAKAYSQKKPGVRGKAEAGDEFGSAITIDDIDGDFFADLVVAAEGEDRKGRSNVGMVHVLWGSGDGVNTADDLLISQATPGVPGKAQSNDLFGSAVAVLDFDGTGARLVVGVRSEDLDGVNAAGVITLMELDRDGVVTAENHSQTGVGVPEPNAWFGATIAH